MDPKQNFYMICAVESDGKNLDAVLVMIVITAGDAIFAKFHSKCLERITTITKIGKAIRESLFPKFAETC